MKTTFKSMMIIAAMTLCTVTGFAKTNTSVNNYNDRNGIAHKECMLKHIHTSKCRTPQPMMHAPVMNREMMKHFAKGKHHFNRYGVCKTCGCTGNEIIRIEREMHKACNTPTVAPHNHMRR